MKNPKQRKKARPAYSTVAKKLREVIESGLCESHFERPSWVSKRHPCALCDLVEEARDIADRALAKRPRSEVN